MRKGLSDKIILSLSYTDQFQYPLKKEEIFLRILGQGNSLTLTDVEFELSKMVIARKIFVKNDFYFLKGSSKHIHTRIKRKTFSQKKWIEVGEFVGIARHIPWIKGILVTGSLAVDNVIENDDIDFLIITQKNRLWISRILAVLIVFSKGRKRSWNGRFSNTWCLNLWLDEESLELPVRLKNVYGAFEICQAVWAYDRGDTKRKFFNLNMWAKKILPNYYIYQKRIIPLVLDTESNNINLFLDFVLNGLNSILFILQYLYMKPHMTSERVEKNFAFFHPRDTKRQLLGRWFRKYKVIV